MFWATFLSIAFATTTVESITLRYAQTVEIEKSFTYDWNADRQQVSNVTILVVEVRPEKTGLPQVGMPVLYVGSTPAARIHPGGHDNHLVVYVAGKPDLATTPIFWGPDELPERVTPQKGQQYQAEMAGSAVKKTVLSAVQRPHMSVSDQTSLLRYMATLIDKYAPADRAFSEGIRGTIQP